MAVDLEVHSMHLHGINNMGASWSAVCCPLFVFKCGRNFPQNSLVLALLAPSASADSVRLFGSWDQTVFNVRLPPQVHVSTPLQGWIGSLAARGPSWQFLVIARLSVCLSINSSGKIRKHVKDCFSSTVSAFQNLRPDRFWLQVLWSEVRTLDLGASSRPFGAAIGLLGAPAGLLGATWFTPDEY